MSTLNNCAKKSCFIPGVESILALEAPTFKIPAQLRDYYRLKELVTYVLLHFSLETFIVFCVVCDTIRYRKLSAIDEINSPKPRMMAWERSPYVLTLSDLFSGQIPTCRRGDKKDSRGFAVVH